MRRLIRITIGLMLAALAVGTTLLLIAPFVAEALRGSLVVFAAKLNLGRAEVIGIVALALAPWWALAAMLVQRDRAKVMRVAVTKKA